MSKYTLITAAGNSDMVMVEVANIKNWSAQTYGFMEKDKADAACIALSSMMPSVRVTITIGNIIKASYECGQRKSWVETTDYVVGNWTEQQKKSLVIYDSLNSIHH